MFACFWLVTLLCLPFLSFPFWFLSDSFLAGLARQFSRGTQAVAAFISLVARLFLAGCGFVGSAEQTGLKAGTRRPDEQEGSE